MIDPATPVKLLTKMIATAVDNTEDITLASAAVLAKTAETLSQLSGSWFLSDISRIKESLIQRIELKNKRAQIEIDRIAVDVEYRAAEAEKTRAEAIKAHNEATLHEQSDFLALAKREQLEVATQKQRAELAAIKAATAKTAAEAESLAAEAERHRSEHEMQTTKCDELALSTAKTELETALIQLTNEGGNLYISLKNLGQIVDTRNGFTEAEFREMLLGFGVKVPDDFNFRGSDTGEL